MTRSLHQVGDEQKPRRRETTRMRLFCPSGQARTTMFGRQFAWVHLEPCHPNQPRKRCREPSRVSIDVLDYGCHCDFDRGYL